MVLFICLNDFHGILHFKGLISGNSVPLNSDGGSSPNAGLQTLTMTNSAVNTTSNTNTTPTIVQYAQGPDGQYFIPGEFNDD